MNIKKLLPAVLLVLSTLSAGASDPPCEPKCTGSETCRQVECGQICEVRCVWPETSCCGWRKKYKQVCTTKYSCTCGASREDETTETSCS